jgi:hypothetical protein
MRVTTREAPEGVKPSWNGFIPQPLRFDLCPGDEPHEEEIHAMKIMAIVDLARDANMQKVRDEITREVQGSWKLFSSGVLREAYATGAPTRVVFVLEAESVAEADAHLRQLPMVAQGLMQVELIELRPFVNWSMLFAKE